MIYIVITVVAIIIFIISVILIKKKQIEINKYYDAAYKMLKEEYLTTSLLKRKREEFYGSVPMVYIKLCNGKPKQGYVFNPEKEITFGRDKNKNSIFIPYPTVSMQQCRIVLYNGCLYLQDLNSSNGTFVKSGLFKTMVSGGASIQLRSKDKIIIAGMVFKITIFDFQMTQ